MLGTIRLFQRLRGRSTPAQPTRGEQRAQIGETRRHLEEFVRSRVGVENVPCQIGKTSVS